MKWWDVNISLYLKDTLHPTTFFFSFLSINSNTSSFILQFVLWFHSVCLYNPQYCCDSSPSWWARGWIQQANWWIWRCISRLWPIVCWREIQPWRKSSPYHLLLNEIDSIFFKDSNFTFENGTRSMLTKYNFKRDRSARHQWQVQDAWKANSSACRW